MGAKHPKLSIIGGGVYVGKLLRELASFSSMPPLRLAIGARDIPRLRVIVDYLRRWLYDKRPDWRLFAARSTREALAGSDAVILLARIGGLPARHHDETFPRRFGLPGDEGLGLGGLANAWRTLPALEQMAGEILLACPEARVLNLMAPLPSTTRLLQESGLDAIGVCELPSTVERDLGSAGPMSYLGVNHLGWFWPRERDDRETLAKAVCAGIAHPETVEAYGAIPLPYYYRVVRPDLADDLGIRAPAHRARQLMDLSRTIFCQMKDPETAYIQELSLRKTPWFREALVPILVSLFTGDEFRGFVNLAGHPGSPLDARGTTLEYRAVYRGSNLTVETPDEPPPAVVAVLEKTVEAQTLMFSACRSRSVSDLAAAVRALAPVPEEKLASLIREIRRPVASFTPYPGRS